MRTCPIDLDWLHRRFPDWWERKVDVRGADECWPWRDSLTITGYGQAYDGTSPRLAHRVAWTLHHGQQIPEGMTIDHVCRNRVCVNPSHLRVLSNAENARLNWQLLKTQCKWGHTYTPENTYTDRKGHRRCRECARALKRAAAA